MPRKISEERTRKEMIDPQLEQAGGYLRDHLFDRHLGTADLYEPPLDMFGADAVERWFSDVEIRELLAFIRLVSVG